MIPLKKNISQSEFQSYCNGAFRHALASLPLSPECSNQPLWVEQAASRALGYANYEALQALWVREQSIRQGVWAEWCNTQKALTIKAMNILAVYQTDLSEWLVTSLRPGEEGRLLGTHSVDSLECAVLHCPAGALFTVPQNAASYLEQCRNRDIEHTDRVHLPFIYTEDGKSLQGYLQVVRTEEGVIFDVFDATGHISSDTVGAMFTDRAVVEDDWLLVNLVDETPCVSTFYRWMQPRDEEDRPELEYIDQDEEFCVSERRFSSAQDAIEMVTSQEWNVDPQYMSDSHAVLIEWTGRVVQSPF